MARLAGTETVAVLATSKSKSLRTTIPFFVVKQVGLENGDHLEWELDKDGDAWHAIVRKKRGAA